MQARVADFLQVLPAAKARDTGAGELDGVEYTLAWVAVIPSRIGGGGGLLAD